MLNERTTLLEDDGIEEEILVEEECSVAQAVWGDIQGNIENQTDLQSALDAKQDSLTETQLNAVNSGITASKVATYDGYADQIASKADQSALNAESVARGEADTALGTRIDNEALTRQNADNGLQSQIDAITSKSDVVDVVANYAALQAYDTSSLSNNDVIKVLDDETHEDALTYYRWSTTTQAWTYIGQEAPYYSKGQMDVALQAKQDKLTAGDNVQIANNVISATDTTYTAGNGLNLNGTEFSADTTVLATKEDLEGYYTKPETDNLLAPKLEAEVVAELPTTGEEGKLYLTPKAHTTQTATGNPITATVSEDAGKIESFQLDGDTYQQTYSGKNLAKTKNGQYTYESAGQSWNINDGKIIASRTMIDYQGGCIDLATGSTGQYATATSGDIKLTANGGTYTLSLSRNGTISTNPQQTSRVGVYAYKMKEGGTKTSLGIVDLSSSTSGSMSITLGQDEYICAIVFYCQFVSFNNVEFKLQLESGSSASDFEPYVGGTPSPNPEYPQPIQTVTGTQTVSINGTDYPLDLGSIELDDLGNGYQDEIAFDGAEWKLRKATIKVQITADSPWNVGSFSAQKRIYTNANSIFSESIVAPSDNAQKAIVLSSHFTAVPLNDILNQTSDGFGISSSSYMSIRVGNATAASDILDILRNNTVEAYAALRTPTETTITDQALIAQLEAIRTAALETGANTITNTATGSNLAGDMEIGYYGYNPTNRYDKWLWLDINNEYEQIGS